MARPSGESKQTYEPHKPKVGTYIAYDRSGKEIWRKEGFTASHDSVPSGTSITMGAGEIIDPSSGEVLHRWNPWGVR